LQRHRFRHWHKLRLINKGGFGKSRGAETLQDRLAAPGTQTALAFQRELAGAKMGCARSTKLTAATRSQQRNNDMIPFLDTVDACADLFDNACAFMASHDWHFPSPVTANKMYVAYLLNKPWRKDEP
jgi:hypothetical protein